MKLNSTFKFVAPVRIAMHASPSPLIRTHRPLIQGPRLRGRTGLRPAAFLAVSGLVHGGLVLLVAGMPAPQQPGTAAAATVAFQIEDAPEPRLDLESASEAAPEPTQVAPAPEEPSPPAPRPPEPARRAQPSHEAPEPAAPAPVEQQVAEPAPPSASEAKPPGEEGVGPSVASSAKGLDVGQRAGSGAPGLGDGTRGTGRGGGGAGSSSEVDVRGLIRDYMVRVARILRAQDVYPLAARRAHKQGTVLLAVRIDEEGGIRGVDVRRSSGHRVLDDAAVASVHRLASVPAPPAALDWGIRALTLPVTYKLD